MTNDLSRLKSQLLNTGLQVKDNPLFQVIDQLIRTLEGMNKQVNSVVIGGSSAVINNNGLGGQGLTIPLATGEHLNGIEYYGDSPYPSLNETIIQQVVNNTNNNVINQNVLMNEYFDKEYADDPYPSLGTALPVPVAGVGGNPTITDDTTTNATMYPVWVTATGTVPLYITSTKLSWNPSFGLLDITGKLTVNQTGTNSIFTNSTNGENGLDITNSSGGTLAYSRLQLANSGFAAGSFRVNSNGYTFVAADSPNIANGVSLTNTGAGGVSIGAIGAAGIFTVFTGGSAAANERMRITAAGLVGIGTISPQNLFVVSNGGARGIEIIPSSGSILCYNRSTVAYAALTLDGLDVSLSLSGTSRFSLVAAGNIGVTAGLKFNFDGTAATGDTYITESAANVLDTFVGGVKILSLSATTATLTAVSAHPQLVIERSTTGTGKYSFAAVNNTLEIKDEVAAAVRLLISATGNISGTGQITSSGGGIGYTAGAGGTVTQLTSRATGVTLNELCGTITLFTATQASQNIATFTLTNSFIEATDIIILLYVGTNATNRGLWNLAATPAAGSAVITCRNVHTGTSASEATPIRFSIIKGVNT